MKENKLKPVRGILLLFIFLTVIFSVFRNRFIQQGFDADMLIAGNLLLLLVSLLSFFLLYRGVRATNPHVFVRAIYTSFILKFFILALAAFIYLMIAKKNINKPSLLVCAGLYIVYSAIEVAAMMKLLKSKKNG